MEEQKVPHIVYELGPITLRLVGSADPLMDLCHELLSVAEDKYEANWKRADVVEAMRDRLVELAEKR